MKKKLIYILFATIFSLILFSCGEEEQKKEEPAEKETENIIEEETETNQVADFSAGEAIYNGKGLCSTCHMAEGQGVEGTFPPLADSDFLKGLSKIDLIKTVISGNNEPITVNGTEYPGSIMSATMANVELTDQEIVDVVNFVSNKWGNNEMVTAEDVQAAKE